MSIKAVADTLSHLLERGRRGHHTEGTDLQKIFNGGQDDHGQAECMRVLGMFLSGGVLISSKKEDPRRAPFSLKPSSEQVDGQWPEDLRIKTGTHTLSPVGICRQKRYGQREVEDFCGYKSAQSEVLVELPRQQGSSIWLQKIRLSCRGHDASAQVMMEAMVTRSTLPIQSSPQRAGELFIKGQRTVPRVADEGISFTTMGREQGQKNSPDTLHLRPLATASLQVLQLLLHQYAASKHETYLFFFRMTKDLDLIMTTLLDLAPTLLDLMPTLLDPIPRPYAYLPPTSLALQSGLQRRDCKWLTCAAPDVAYGLTPPSSCQSLPVRLVHPSRESQCQQETTNTRHRQGAPSQPFPAGSIGILVRC
ncbi:uncharacterized protein ARMOST_12058 [Armillaria ostoyae]|uniref:Uncharacterized protein n=1 Tax=Armillaria ostoyae TaxID=47428 RepID=A0A284RIV5_ARMOS|nr:uncharacterized protein ARMOST_12058 [Armillaria ostoyae]